MASPDAETRRTSKKYVRTFIFSMRIGTPIEKLHVVTKFLMIAVMSVLTLYMFDIPVSKGGPDVIGLILLLGLVFSLLIISRTAKYLAGSYLVLAVPIIFGEFFYWLFFNGSQPGAKMTFYLWPGFLPIGVSTLVLVGVFSLVYYKTRSIGWSLVAGLLLWWFTIMPSAISFSSAATWARISIGAGYSFSLPQWAATVAFAKALGYAVLIYTSFLFLLTTRDVEIAGALRQLKLSFKKSFFVALMFRNLNAILIDYQDIRMAQTARASGVIRKSIFTKVMDLARLSIPLVANMIRRSTEMGVALYARGFEASSKMTDYKETKRLSYVDLTIIVILAAFLIYEVFLGHSITALFVR
ncbi:MAG: energy-coupling factor transporter transmembrane component T family protein [Candidatus Bathyarchaeia archaeon]